MQYDIKKLVVDASVSFSICQNFKHVTQARNIFCFILYLDDIAFGTLKRFVGSEFCDHFIYTIII